MANVIQSLPRDESGEAMQNYPAPYKANAVYMTTASAASSIISLNPNTTHLEVATSGGQGAVLRWVPLTETAAGTPFGSVIASGLGANFDHFIPVGSFRRFIVPKETQGTYAGQAGSIMGLYQRVAIAPSGIGVSSVMVSEF